MNTILKNSLSSNKTLLILSLISILLGVLSCILGELCVPFIAGVLAAIYFFDNKSKHGFSIVVSVLLIEANIASIFLGYAVTLFAPWVIILSLIISSSFKKGESKSYSVYLMTVVSAVLATLGYFLFAMIEQGSYTLDAAMDYYKAIIEDIRHVCVDEFYQIYSASGFDVTTEVISKVFDNWVSMIISFLFIGGFITSVIAMKIFGAVVSKCAEDNSEIKGWRFSANKLFGYAYVLLVILSIFTLSSDTVFAISVKNLYNVFMVIFAYIGFNIALDMLKKRTNPIVAVFLLGCALIFCASFTAQILAAIGTLYSMRRTPDVMGEQ